MCTTLALRKLKSFYQQREGIPSFAETQQMLNNSFSQNKGLLGLLEMKNGIGGMEKGVVGSMLHSMMFSLQFFVLQYVYFHNVRMTF